MVSWIGFVIFYLAAAFWHENGCAGVGLLGISRTVTAMKAVLLGIATEFLGEEIYIHCRFMFTCDGQGVVASEREEFRH